MARTTDTYCSGLSQIGSTFRFLHWSRKKTETNRTRSKSAFTHRHSRAFWRLSECALNIMKTTNKREDKLHHTRWNVFSFRCLFSQRAGNVQLSLELIMCKTTRTLLTENHALFLSKQLMPTTNADAWLRAQGQPARTSTTNLSSIDSGNLSTSHVKIGHRPCLKRVLTTFRNKQVTAMSNIFTNFEIDKKYLSRQKPNERRF